MNIQKIREVFLKIVISLLFFNIFYLPILILNNISAIEILTLMIVSIIIEFVITKLYRLLFKIDKKVKLPAPISTRPIQNIWIRRDSLHSLPLAILLQINFTGTEKVSLQKSRVPPNTTLISGEILLKSIPG